MGREEEGLLAGCLGEFHYLVFHTRNSKERYQMIGSKGKQSMIGFCHFSTTQELIIDLKKFALSPRFFLRGRGRLYIGYIVSSCNSFPSYPSKAKDIQSSRCSSLVIFNKTKQFFPGLSLIPVFFRV